MNTINKNGLKINSKFLEFINNEVIPGTKINPDKFWDGFEKAVNELAPANKSLIDKREIIQKKLIYGTKIMLEKILIKKIILIF